VAGGAPVGVGVRRGIGVPGVPCVHREDVACQLDRGEEPGDDADAERGERGSRTEVTGGTGRGGDRDAAGDEGDAQHRDRDRRR
jgi:hypothetical protein